VKSFFETKMVITLNLALEQKTEKFFVSEEKSFIGSAKLGHFTIIDFFLYETKQSNYTAKIGKRS